MKDKKNPNNFNKKSNKKIKSKLSGRKNSYDLKI